MNVQIDEIYSEVYSVLNLLGNDYKKRLPKNLLNLIENKRNLSYEPKYNSEISLLEQKIKRESLSIIALFHLNYWCDSEEEKNELKELFKTNEQKYQAYIKEKYNPDNIFKNNTKPKVIEPETASNTLNENIIQNTELADIKENIFQKIIRKIKSYILK